MTWFTNWRARRRWQREQGPREVWVHLLDQSGRVVASTPTVVDPTDPGWFANMGTISFRDLPAATVTTIRVVDANGNTADLPMT